MKTERLDKVLSKHGFGSRKDVKKMLHSKTVTINGTVCTEAEYKLNLESDILAVDGETINLKENIYIMMNKSQNVVCSSKDGVHQTVFDLLPEELNHNFLGGELHCTGRLDIDTEGLLILTTDGTLTHKLISPKNKIGKVYFVTLRDSLNNAEQSRYIEQCQKGLEIPPEHNEQGFTAEPAELTFLDENTCHLKIYEGKFHQVKRMFAVLGNKVTFLKRVQIGSLKLDENLQPSDFKELTEDDLSLLFN